MKVVIDTMKEELNDARNDLEKQMVLQKYGIVEPKLTKNELMAINFEKLGGVVEYNQVFGTNMENPQEIPEFKIV